MPTATNTDLINQTLKFICTQLNQHRINYYIAGAIGAYIDAGLPPQRTHTDLDILIEESALPKLAKIFQNTDFTFHDNRLTSNKVLNQSGYTDGDHEVYAENQQNGFQIGFFLFHSDDHSYTITEYFRENNLQKKLERTLPIQFFAAQYNNVPTEYMGIPLKTVRKELVYKNKLAMNREKDLFDLEKLKPTIENAKLKKLQGLSQYRKTKIINL